MILRLFRRLQTICRVIARAPCLIALACVVSILPAGLMASGERPPDQVDCNPYLSIKLVDAPFQASLEDLSRRYGFELSYQLDTDRTVTIDRRATLRVILEQMTEDTSTVFVNTKPPACAGEALARLIVLPKGDESIPDGLPGPAVTVHTEEQGPGTSYQYIEDMERYAWDVMEGKVKTDINSLTPEQRVELRRLIKHNRKAFNEKKKAGELAKRGPEGNSDPAAATPQELRPDGSPDAAAAAVE